MKKSRIAIPVIKNQVAIRFDCCEEINIYSVANEDATLRQTIIFDEQNVLKSIIALRDEEVDLIICGRVSQFLYRIIVSSNIKLISDIFGNINEVIEGYITGNLVSKPCPKGRMKQGRQRRRRGQFFRRKNILL